MATDFEQEGLLEGLDGDAAEARLDLLRRLESDGFSAAELRQAADEDRLALLPVEKVLTGDGERYSANDIARLSGLDRAFLDALWRALGLALADPDEETYTELDLEAAKSVQRFREAGMPDEGILEITRVMSQGMANVAAATARLFSEAFLEAGDTESDVAFRYTEATRELVPHFATALLHVLNVQQREQIRRAAVDSGMLASGRTQDAAMVAVGFADLAGFTRLGESVPADELGAVAGRLAELSADLAKPPVRLVKTIGDAAMLVSEAADDLIDTALDLVDAAEAEGEDFPALRVGVAAGEAFTRSGDWYGRPVNLASRITSFARPGSVVVSEDVREAATENAYKWSFAGERRFKGVEDEVAVFRVRRPEPAE